MRGKLLGFDPDIGKGVISTDDGTRYHVAREDWKAVSDPQIGETVDFEPRGGDAVAVFSLTQPPATTQQAAMTLPDDNKKLIAALLAFFLGAIGVHKFYLGKTGAGITMALISIFGIILLAIPTIIIGIIAFIEFIIYLMTPNDEFHAKYVEGDRAWF